MPSNVPAAKLMIVARPAGPMVMARARITLVTVDGWELNGDSQIAVKQLPPVVQVLTP
jgi:hypothetical protein